MAVSASYEFWLSRTNRERIAFLEPRSWEYVLGINGHSWCALVLDTSVDSLLGADCRVVIWRRPPGGTLGLEMVGLIRLRDLRGTDKDEWTRLSGPDVSDLLDHRIVGYPAASAQTDKTALADDMMKAIVRENLGGGAVAARDISGLTFSIQADLGDGPGITKAFAWRNMLKVLRDIAAVSKTEGTEVFFAVVPTTETTFEFQTFTGQPGADRTQTGGANPLTISEEWGNLKDPRLRYDYVKERNYIYAGGRGAEAEREIVEVSDATRIATSQWNRREAFVHAVNAKTTAGITAAGNAGLAEGRPRTLFTGTLVDMPDSRYGIDWRHGDQMTAIYRGQQFDVIARAVHVRVNEAGDETITAKLEYQE